MPDNEMAGWHHRLDGHEFEQALGVGDGQGSLVCCSPWLGRHISIAGDIDSIPDRELGSLCLVVHQKKKERKN